MYCHMQVNLTTITLVVNDLSTCNCVYVHVPAICGYDSGAVSVNCLNSETEVELKYDVSYNFNNCIHSVVPCLLKIAL